MQNYHGKLHNSRARTTVTKLYFENDTTVENEGYRTITNIILIVVV